jgi:CHAD domain-containing protein
MPELSFPYKFSPKRKPGGEFGRVLKQISARMGKLRQARPDDDTETVHEVRTTIKLLRTLLWFAQPALAPTTLAFAKIELQNAARILATRRDLTAMQSTLKSLAEENDTPKEREVIHRTGVFLAARAPKTRPGALLRQRNEAIALVQKTCRLLVHAAAAGSSWKSPKRRLRKARAAAERAREIAEDNPTPIHLHEWRKKVKRLLYLLQLFHPEPKGKKKRAIEKVDELQHHLGDHHDTVVLHEHLTRRHFAQTAKPEFRPLFGLLEVRLKRLQKKAAKTARKF